MGRVLDNPTPYKSNQLSIIRGRVSNDRNAGMFSSVIMDDSIHNRTKDYMRQYKLNEVYDNFKMDLPTFMKLSIIETDIIIELCQEFNREKAKALNKGRDKI